MPEVLFVCLHNAGRSQLAATLLAGYGLGRIAVRSAVPEPAEKVNIAAAVPTKLCTQDVEASDVVITMGCGGTCPIIPGMRYLDWQVADHAGQSLEAVRPIRDEIDCRLRGRTTRWREPARQSTRRRSHRRVHALPLTELGVTARS